jgi:AsmA protein
VNRLLKIAALLFVALAVFVAGAAYFFDANQFRPLLEAELTKALAREVKVGDLKLAILSGSVAANDLSIAEDPAFGTAPFVRAKSVKIGVELRPLVFSRTLNVTGRNIEEPEINLLQNEPGQWNYATVGAAAAPAAPATGVPARAGNLDLSVRSLKISDGRMVVGRPKGQGAPHKFEKVNAEIRDYSATSAFPFKLSANGPGGGELKLDGRAGPIDAKDASMTPVESALKVSHLDLQPSGFLEPTSPLAGVIDIDGNVASNGRTIQTKGKIKAEKLRLARDGSPSKSPVAFDFTLDHDVAKRAGTLSRGVIGIGKATASLAGNYTMRTGSPLLSMRLSGSQMAIDELAQMLPPLGIVLPSGSSLQGGTATAKLTVEGPADALTVAGPMSLNNTRLAGFDLGSKLRTVAALAGIKISPDTDIQTLSATVRSAPGGTNVDELVFIVPTIGELTGAGVVSPSNQLDFKMKVKLHTSGNVMAALGQKSDTTVPFFVRGTAASPSFVPDVKSIATEKAAALLKSERVQSVLDKSEAGKKAKGLLEGLFGKKK